MTTIISYYTILATLVVVWCSDHTGAIPLAITTGPHQGEHHITKTSSLLPVATTTTTTTQHNTSYLIGLVQHHLNSLLDSVRQVCVVLCLHVCTFYHLPNRLSMTHNNLPRHASLTIWLKTTP